MTLIEVLISASISGVIVLATMSTFIMSLRETAKSYRYNKANKEAHVLADTIARDLRAASGMEPSWFDGTTTHSTSVSSGVVLRVPSIDSSGIITSMTSPVVDHIIYEPSASNPNVLQRTVFPAAGSSRLSETRDYGDAYSQTSYRGSWAVKPDAMGAIVIYFQYLIQRASPVHRTDPVSGEDAVTTFTMPVSGSVRMRNHP